MDLKEARFKKGLTQYDVRIKTGIHQSKLSLIERGYILPRPDEKQKLASLYGVRPEEISWPEERLYISP